MHAAGGAPLRELAPAAHASPSRLAPSANTFFSWTHPCRGCGAPGLPPRRTSSAIQSADPSGDGRWWPRAQGVFLKWLIDETFGATHHRLLFIEYLPGVAIGLHDHAYEEAYFILSGEVEATMDGKRYLAKAGDVLWTGVGCVHAFANTGREPVRWLETFSAQPPSENVFRFMAEWEQRARELEGSGAS